MSGEGEGELQSLADGSAAAFCDGSEYHVSKSVKSPIIALARCLLLRRVCSAGCSRDLCCSELSSVLLPLEIGNGWDNVDTGVIRQHM